MIYMNKKQYEQYVKEITPVHNLGLNMCRAFLTGGLICTLGQFILNTAQNYGLNQETAGSWCSLILILISVLLTGLNLYSKIGRFAGAGSLVPITGFANAVVSPAIDFKTEGFVTGMAAKMFLVAGPVIVFGTVASTLYGLIIWLAG